MHFVIAARAPSFIANVNGVLVVALAPGLFLSLGFWPPQWKKRSQSPNVNRAARQGYITIGGESASPRCTANNRNRVPAASRIPKAKQISQAGKKEPRMLNDGAC